MESKLRIGIDIGGTFTDFVVFHPTLNTPISFKVLSTPQDPTNAVLQGLNRVHKFIKVDKNTIIEIIHGSTIATNALLERKGARTAFVTTHGFKDIIVIGRQNREALYNLVPSRPETLVPDDLRFEIMERIGSSGKILIPLDTNSIGELISSLELIHPESIAVCFLFSFANPTHENEIGGYLRRAGYTVSLSSEVLPEYREYERFSTTCINAYVSPVLQKYLIKLEKSINLKISRKGVKNHIRIMQSNGGIIRIDEAQRNGVRCILSGPAGGVIGAYHIAQLITRAGNWDKDKQHLKQRIISFDMGGTSTDVSLIEKKPAITSEATIGGFPIRIPVLDIHTIGAGGGSIASIDAGGVLRVGPQSAGADPGPACYGKGWLPTVTDANLVLGRLIPQYFLGGRMEIDAARSRKALEPLGAQLALGSGEKVISTALGMIEIINAHMERAIRVISIERGHDPGDFTLLSFGGAGGLHAADLARSLGIPRVLVPPLASTLSAYGMLEADIVRDYLQTVMLPEHTSFSDIKLRFTPLIEQGTCDLVKEGYSGDNIIIEPMLDMRYKGQSYEITIPFMETYLQDFRLAHQRAYGITHEGAEVEIVNVRIRVIGEVSPIPVTEATQLSSDPSSAMRERCNIIFDSGVENSQVYSGEALRPGNDIYGPALIARTDTSILVGKNDKARIDGFGNLHIDINFKKL